MGEFKKGDRVRAIKECNLFRVRPGIEGSVEYEDEGYHNGRWCVAVTWAHALPCGKSLSRVPADLLELVSPAAAAVKACSSECASLRAQRAAAEKSHEDCLAELLKITAERDALVLAIGNNERAGDIAASRDRLRSENHELTTRVAWLERELARARGGRR